MQDSALGGTATILVCDGCHTMCDTCKHRFYCYTVGTILGTKAEVSSAIKKLYKEEIYANNAQE